VSESDPNDPDGEESGRTLPPNADLEEALREAVESVDARRAPGARKPKAEPEPEASPEGAPEAEGEGGDELARTKDRLLRLQADFENFRRRALQERRDLHQYGAENLVKDLLATVDNLERAIGHARESADGDLEALLQGVELVQRELLSTLSKHSVNEVEARGKPFDPAVHEAVAQLPDGSVAVNTVIEVLQKGYQLRDRLLRPTSVVVSKAPEPADGAGSTATPDTEGEGEAGG
jgi:molecular chaperone GrpE